VLVRFDHIARVVVNADHSRHGSHRGTTCLAVGANRSPRAVPIFS
jgi:hypothetical protein